MSAVHEGAPVTVPVEMTGILSEPRHGDRWGNRIPRLCTHPNNTTTRKSSEVLGSKIEVRSADTYEYNTPQAPTIAGNKAKMRNTSASVIRYRPFPLSHRFV